MIANSKSPLEFIGVKKLNSNCFVLFLLATLSLSRATILSFLVFRGESVKALGAKTEAAKM